MISEDAVEAAKRRVDDAASISTIREILEAAAPHIAAAALNSAADYIDVRPNIKGTAVVSSAWLRSRAEQIKSEL